MRLGLRSWLRRRTRAITGIDRAVIEALSIPVGQIGLDEARFLGDLVRDLQTPGPIIEIGTLFGWSTRVITLFKAPDRQLITVDNYCWNPLGITSEQHRRSTAATLAEAVESHNVRIIVRDKDQFYADYTGPSPALVFLDAIHSYEHTKADIDWARAAGAGVICLHDYSSEHPGVVRAVDEAGGPRRLVRTLAVL